MSDLSPVNWYLPRIEQEIRDLKRGKEGAHFRPHKLLMLLSVIELAERGLLKENKIYLSDTLLEIFENYFRVFRRKNDLCQPGPPFFHLRSSGFWFHAIKPGMEESYQKLTTTGGGLGLINKHIEYAYLRQDFFEVLQDSLSRQKIRALVVELLSSD